MSTPAVTVHDAFSRVAARRGDAEFLCVEAVTAAAYGIDAGPRSWREVAGEVERLRAAYAQAGYGHGHRIGLLLENRPGFFTHWLALNALGVSIVPIHADLRAEELTYLIGHSEIGLAVALPHREGALRAAGIEANITLDTMPNSDYWNLWTETPVGVTPWTHRPLAVMVLPLAYIAGPDGKPVPWNESRWVDQEFTDLLLKAQGTLDVEKRRAIMKDIERIQMERGSIAVAWWQNIWRPANPGFIGIGTHPTEYYLWREVWYDPDKDTIKS